MLATCYGEFKPKHTWLHLTKMGLFIFQDILGRLFALALKETRRGSSSVWGTPGRHRTGYSIILVANVLWPLLLTWFNFNPSMDK